MLQLDGLADVVSGTLSAPESSKPVLIPATRLCLEVLHSQRGSTEVTLPDFRFPLPSYYESLPALWGSAGLAGLAGAGQAVEDKLKSFFRIIAVNLPVHGSESMIETQAQEILKRIPGEDGSSQFLAARRVPMLRDVAETARRKFQDQRSSASHFEDDDLVHLMPSMPLSDPIDSEPEDGDSIFAL